MGKYGFQSTQGGIPIKRAADYQKTMDDRWPVVEFMFMDMVVVANYVVPAGSGNHYVPVYEHNLGHLPGFFWKDISMSGFSTFNATLESLALADKRYIYLPISRTGADQRVSFKIWLAVLDRDISVEFQAPIDTPLATSASTTSPYGLRIMPRPGGAGMEQGDKSVFSFNTDAKSIGIQAHGIRTAQVTGTYAGSILIDHHLGYPPTYYVAQRFVVPYSNDPMLGQTMHAALGAGSGIGFSDGNTLRIRGAQAALSGDYTFIILKDPVDVSA